MHSSSLLVLPILYALFMHISLVQLLAFNSETGNVPVKCIVRERQALLSLKQGFQLNNDHWLSSWGDAENNRECCNWEGIQCSNQTGHVLKLDLHASNYVTLGSISPSLGELHHLNYLDLSYISFNLTPSIPDSIASLTLLRHLNLSHSSFQGGIPHELGKLIFLEHLDLGHNILSGEIPREFSNLSNLVQLDLGWNLLNGEIPSQLSNLSLLRYMDLSANLFSGAIPPELGSLVSLKHLDMSQNYFTGVIPHDFMNIANVQYLDLSPNNKMSLRSDLRWLSHLSSLRHLSLCGIDLSNANNWQQLVSGFSHLQYLDFGGCNLSDSFPSSSLSSAVNFSSILSFVDLSNNYLVNSSLIFPWLMSSASTLAILKLNDNGLEGTIPITFGDLSFIEELNLANNKLKGSIPLSMFHICSLRELDLSENRLTGQFHEFVQALLSHCAYKPLLQTLNVGWNEITGTMPDISQLSSLQVLRLDSNKLNGTIHEGIGQLSNLIELTFRNNSFECLISETHFSRLFNLSTLDLSHNALIFDVGTEWVPPFNLININLASCVLGPDFPRWLQTQRKIFWLDISNAKISGTIPNWFWNLTPMMVKLNISHNQIGGEIEDSPVVLNKALQIDLSSNLFEGPIPTFLSISSQVFLSNNRFSTTNSFLCANNSISINFLDLSNNHLKGELPDCWMSFQSLGFLDLSDNYFYGNLPRSMGSLTQIQSIHLGGNNFSGGIPMSLINCTKLQVFNAPMNNFSGPLPSWIGDHLPNLLVLSLHSNNFHGSMPLSICHLGKLRLLDLSANNFSGNIPKCISNLFAMAGQGNSNADISYPYDSYYDDFSGIINNFRVYDDSASLIWKGKMSKYRSTLGLLRSIDFSNNRLIGEIPSEIMSLVDLVSLNISRNMLSGEIPPTIGQLESLDFLDFSRNQLLGRIPPQLSQLDRLSVLDLSYNDLSGEIPTGTQLQTRDSSAYVGNPMLCGPPLDKTCPIDGDQIDEDDDHDSEQFFSEEFYIALSIGFIIGFWGVCCSLILRESWRYAYFKFLNDVYDKLFVPKATKMAKPQRIKS